MILLVSKKLECIDLRKTMWIMDIVIQTYYTNLAAMHLVAISINGKKGGSYKNENKSRLSVVKAMKFL